MVAWRQPGNPLGWLYLLIASCLFLATDGGDYSSFVYRHGHHLPFNAVGLALDQTWAEGIVLFVLAILLFPDGKLLSPFWRWPCEPIAPCTPGSSLLPSWRRRKLFPGTRCASTRPALEPAHVSMWLGDLGRGSGPQR